MTRTPLKMKVSLTDSEPHPNEPAPDELLLRPVEPNDVAIFYEQQLDPVANQMAAFTVKNPADRDAFAVHWEKILADENLTIRTILAQDNVAGYVVCHGWSGPPEVSYWIGREYWGLGVATKALAALLKLVTVRPLFGRAAKDNFASRRVLEKCGFQVVGAERSFANARGEEIDELILRLGTNESDEASGR